LNSNEYSGVGPYCITSSTVCRWPIHWPVGGH